MITSMVALSWAVIDDSMMKAEQVEIFSSVVWPPSPYHAPFQTLGAPQDRPDRGLARFYSLLVERDLFSTIRLVRNWGRIGTKGQELVQVFATEIEAGAAFERVKRQRGYRDL
jgi:predicted DNA-binding WGR domain protein